MGPFGEIRLGGTHLIGAFSLDTARITGEGGPHDPRLVLPLTLTSHAVESGAQLALCSLTCALHVGMSVLPSNQYGPEVTVRPWQGGLVRLFPPQPLTLEARIPLTLPLLFQIEEQRHSRADKAFAGTLRFHGTMAWVAQAFNATPNPLAPAPTIPIGKAPFPNAMGMLFHLVPFDLTRIEDLSISVSKELWIAQVLPGLGFTHLRLVELELPSSGGPLPDSVVADFDAARREFDGGRYRECIQKCRDIRTAVEGYFKEVDADYTPAPGEKDAKFVYTIVKRRLRLVDDSPQYVYLENSWNAWIVLASASHHSRDYTAADAQACLYHGAILLRYLTDLFKPPPLGLRKGTP